MEADAPLIEARDVHMHFGHVIALAGISFMLSAGEVHCLLGDNGAGKSTLIKILSGVFRPSGGEYLVGGRAAQFTSPRDALDAGIATVFQDLGLVPLMSITRNFFMGREPVRWAGPFRIMHFRYAERVAREEMRRIGIDIRDAEQAVGTLSGGERQCLAIARAVFFGARVLILDEPTSALGVAQTSMVLRYIHQVRSKGLGVIFITHNVRHAMAVGDAFTVLNRGRVAGRFRRGEAGIEDLQGLMAGGKELAELAAELGGTV
ncbi:MAG: ATP-binding cassette domain-containing protein [Acetobacteraceae bacterium]